ncbi:MAG: efflux RND transporter periplasmic adaptor subunit, partial [Bacteroidota bacterium]
LILAVSLLTIIKKHNQSDLTQNYEYFSVRRMNLNETIDATGKVLALEKKDLYADYEGAVAAINVKGGDYVKKGDILLTIKSSVLRDQWREADTALKQAELNLVQASALLTTELALNRIQKTNAIQLESYTHQVSLYREQVSQAKSRLNALKDKNDGYYMADNEKLFIRAPFTGKVAWINIQPGDRVTPQTLLGTVIKPDAIGVEAQIDQNDINLVKPGHKAIVTGKDKAQSENAGLVYETSILGKENEEVVNFPVRIKLNGTPRGLQPGMQVDVTVLAEEHTDVLAVPAGSVIQKDGRDLVQVKREDRLVTVPVELGLKRGKYWEVESGLKEGDEVAVAKPEIAKGPAGLNRGTRLRMPGIRR